jgi:hypothetical protein
VAELWLFLCTLGNHQGQALDDDRNAAMEPALLITRPDDLVRCYRASVTGSHVAAFLGSVAVVLYFVITPLLVRRSASKLLPWAIGARLGSVDDRVSRRVRVMTWDPGSPLGRRSGWLYGKGRATYRLGDDGLVHLRFERSDGKVIEKAGPIPPPRPGASAGRHPLYGLLAMIACTAAVGAAVGSVIAASASSSRLVGAAWGLLVGLGAGWVAATVVVAVLRIRRSRAHGG